MNFEQTFSTSCTPISKPSVTFITFAGRGRPLRGIRSSVHGTARDGACEAAIEAWRRRPARPGPAMPGRRCPRSEGVPSRAKRRRRRPHLRAKQGAAAAAQRQKRGKLRLPSRFRWPAACRYQTYIGHVSQRMARINQTMRNTESSPDKPDHAQNRK